MDANTKKVAATLRKLKRLRVPSEEEEAMNNLNMLKKRSVEATSVRRVEPRAGTTVRRVEPRARRRNMTRRRK
jgi:hypothetical protein